MRLLSHRKVALLLLPAQVRASPYRADELRHFDAAQAEELRAVPQPAGGAVNAQLYGERVTRMLLLLYDGPRTLEAGDGLCVSAASQAAQKPDYVIVSPPEAWSGIQRATVEWIPGDERP